MTISYTTGNASKIRNDLAKHHQEKLPARLQAAGRIAGQRTLKEAFEAQLNRS